MTYLTIYKLIILVSNMILFHLQMMCVISYKRHKPPLSVTLTDLISLDLTISFYMATISTGCIHIIVALDCVMIKNITSLPLSLSMTFWCFCFAIYMPMGVTVKFLLMMQKTTNISELATDETVSKWLRILAGGVAMTLTILCAIYSGPAEGLILYAVSQNPIENHENVMPTSVYAMAMLNCFSLIIIIVLKVCLYKAKCRTNNLLGFKNNSSSNNGQSVLYIFTALAIMISGLVVRYILPYEVRSLVIYVSVCMLWPSFFTFAEKKLTKSIIRRVARLIQNQRK